MRVAGRGCTSLFLLLLLAACGPRAQGREPGPNGGGVGVADALAVVAGCKLQNNCGYGAFCNRETGFCVVRKCSEGCPNETVCNEGLDRCQDPPPPRLPNDRLPQDDKLQTLPGAH